MARRQRCWGRPRMCGERRHQGQSLPGRGSAPNATAEMHDPAALHMHLSPLFRSAGTPTSCVGSWDVRKARWTRPAGETWKAHRGFGLAVIRANARSPCRTVARACIRGLANQSDECVRDAVVLRVHCAGQGAPASIQVLNAATVSAREAGGSVRVPPGCQPQPTSLSSRTCACLAAKSLPPVALAALDGLA